MTWEINQKIYFKPEILSHHGDNFLHALQFMIENLLFVSIDDKKGNKKLNAS